MQKRSAIVQKPSTMETRAVVKVYNITDWVSEIKYCDLEGLKHQAVTEPLPLVVGSVEFVREALGHFGIVEPDPMDYDNRIKDLLNRHIELMSVGRALSRVVRFFVKPCKGRAFTGFIRDPLDEYEYSHDFEQFNKFLALPGDEKVWVSEVVNFVAEWRVYVLKGKVLAVCRYDANEEEFEPCQQFIQECVSRFDGETLAIDVGLDDYGQFSIVEINDAWAIGFYKGISERDYFSFLLARWEEILKSKI